MFVYLLKHKLIIGIILVFIFIGGYFGYKNFLKKGGETRYTLAAAEKGAIIVSVSGSGQISASDQIDIKPRISGEIKTIYIEKGDEVKAGQLIMKLDDADFQKAVREAETSLETAKLELEDLLEPPDELALLQAENALAQAKESKQKAEDNIKKAYEDAFNTIANAFLDLPTLITGVRDILYSYEIGKSEVLVSDYQQNVDACRNAFDPQDRDKLEPFVKSAENSYENAREKYDQNFENYKNTSRYSEEKVIEDLLNETIETVKSIAETIKNETNLLDFVVDYFSKHDRRVYSKITEYQSDLKGYTSKANSHLVNLLAIQRSLQDNREAIINAERIIKERELSLAKLKKGPDELNIRVKKNTIQQKEDVLVTAKENLAKCFIYAPFDGLISDVKVKKGDSVSSGTTLATLITKQKIAEISLNEVDAAKVKVNQKATLTFDALPDVTITGKVIEIDPVGTISQGVVSYGVKLALDTADERIKPGMSVTAEIIIDTKLNVLVLPNSAIKSQGGIYYVELAEIPEDKKQEYLNNRAGVILPTQPKRQQIEVGVANDSLTEILSGLKEGDIVISSIISQTKTTQTQRSQQFQIPGMSRPMRIR